jgi:hypothetical protein
MMWMFWIELTETSVPGQQCYRRQGIGEKGTGVCHQHMGMCLV